MCVNGSSPLCPAAGEEPGAVVGPRSHPVSPLQPGQRRLELRHRHVGSHVLRREALLGHVQPGRESGGRGGAGDIAIANGVGRGAAAAPRASCGEGGLSQAFACDLHGSA